MNPLNAETKAYLQKLRSMAEQNIDVDGETLQSLLDTLSAIENLVNKSGKKRKGAGQ